VSEHPDSIVVFGKRDCRCCYRQGRMIVFHYVTVQRNVGEPGLCSDCPTSALFLFPSCVRH
jgi:hypothetical protein